MKSIFLMKAVSLVVLILVLAGCPSTKNEGCLWGRVDLNESIDDSTVTVLDATTSASLWQGKSVDGDFFTRLDTTLETVLSGKDLIVTATGGDIGGVPFTGVLKARVPEYALSDHITVNILTTIIAEYMETWPVTYNEAIQDVFDYLNLPLNTSLIESLHQDNNDMWFDADIFLDEAALYGGFNAYVTFLVENEIGWDDNDTSFSDVWPDPDFDVQTKDVDAFLAPILKWVGGKVLDSAGGWVGDEAIGWVLSMFGFQDQNDARFDAIDKQLEKMDAKLDVVVSDLDMITSQLSVLLSTMQLSRDQIIQQISGYNISAPQDIINNQYDNLVLLYNHGSVTAHTAQGYNDAIMFVDELLTGAHDIDQQLRNLHSGIVGATVGTTGFLDACTNVLIDRANNGADLLTCYMVLESYFSELVGVEAKGLVLMSEALHFRHNDLNPKDKMFTGTVAQFHAKYTTQVEGQVEKFLSCVDRLIVSQFNVRTNLANPVKILPDNAGTIYRRADYLAAQLHSKQPTGFVIRLIGTPMELHDALNGTGVSLNNRTIQVDTVNRTAFATDTDTRCTLVSYRTNLESTKEETVHFYPAALPAYYSTKGYLEWGPEETGIIQPFHLQAQIAVAKLVAGTSSAPSTNSFSYILSRSLSPRTWSIEPESVFNRRSVGDWEDELDTYDDSLQPADAGTTYHNLLVPLRRIPSALPANSSTCNAPNRVSYNFDFDSFKIAAIVSIYDWHRWYGRYSLASTYDWITFLRPYDAASNCTIGVKTNAATMLHVTVPAPYCKQDASFTQQALLGNTATTALGVGGHDMVRTQSKVVTYGPTETGVQATSTSVSYITKLHLVLKLQTNGEVDRRPSVIPQDGYIKYSQLELYPAP